MKNLKGLTINQAREQIKKIESNNFFQICICERKIIEKNLKKAFKKIRQYNDKNKRIYFIRTIERRYYAINENIENENIIKDCIIEKGEHSYFYIEGNNNTESHKHNIYCLVVEHLQKGNKGKAQNHLIDSKEIEYKENELTRNQKRFTL